MNTSSTYDCQRNKAQPNSRALRCVAPSPNSSARLNDLIFPIMMSRMLLPWRLHIKSYGFAYFPFYLHIWAFIINCCFMHTLATERFVEFWVAPTQIQSHRRLWICSPVCILPRQSNNNAHSLDLARQKTEHTRIWEHCTSNSDQQQKKGIFLNGFSVWKSIVAFFTADAVSLHGQAWIIMY